MSDPVIRFIAAIVLIGLGFGLYRLINLVILARAGNASATTEEVKPGLPSILYFTTPDCVPCKTVQRPAIQRVQETLGQRMQVVEVNAYDQPELAKKWGVLSVPTTFILDAQGRPKAVNHGTTPANKLLKQLSEVMQVQ
jgi:thiol-disulfide isomerase/thioredoxin